MNYYDTLIEVADDCPTKKAQVPRARGGKKTEAWLTTRSSSSIHTVTPRKKFLSKGHPHLRVSPLAKRYGWGIHNDVTGKIALIALESSRYEQHWDAAQSTQWCSRPEPDRARQK